MCGIENIVNEVLDNFKLFTLYKKTQNKHNGIIYDPICIISKYIISNNTLYNHTLLILLKNNLIQFIDSNIYDPKTDLFEAILLGITTYSLIGYEFSIELKNHITNKLYELVKKDITLEENKILEKLNKIRKNLGIDKLDYNSILAYYKCLYNSNTEQIKIMSSIINSLINSSYISKDMHILDRGGDIANHLNNEQYAQFENSTKDLKIYLEERNMH